MMISEKLKDFENWLDGFLNFEKLPQKNMFWLEAMESLCAGLNHPEIFAPCIHVAGSKGKGSVSQMIASILDAAGCKTALYTSPHIQSIFERATLAHSPLKEKSYEDAAEELRSFIEKSTEREISSSRPLTWFELLTMFAFLSFRKEGVDWSVFEVGLGGRLDATNVITPRVSVITPIELEHTEFLGDTLEKIAGEKGGIIKRGIPVVSSAQSEEVRAVLTKIATEKGSPIYFADDFFEFDKFTRSYEHGFMSSMIFGKAFPRALKIRMKMLGKLQVENAALAALAIRTALPKLSRRTIELGLSASFLPARFELIEKKKLKIPVVLDGAHTLNSAKASVETFCEIFGNTDAVLLFACAADKNVRKIAPVFSGFSHVFLTRPGENKKSDLGEAQMAFSLAEIDFTAERNYKIAIKTAFETAVRLKKPLFVTGSFYLVAEVKKILSI